MESIIISAEIKPEDANVLETILKKFKAKSITKKKKDPTKMSEEEFFHMIDKRRKSKNIKLNIKRNIFPISKSIKSLEIKIHSRKSVHFYWK